MSYRKGLICSISRKLQILFWFLRLTRINNFYFSWFSFKTNTIATGKHFCIPLAFQINKIWKSFFFGREQINVPEHVCKTWQDGFLYSTLCSSYQRKALLCLSLFHYLQEFHWCFLMIHFQAHLLLSNQQKKESCL